MVPIFNYLKDLVANILFHPSFNNSRAQTVKIQIDHSDDSKRTINKKKSISRGKLRSLALKGVHKRNLCGNKIIQLIKRQIPPMESKIAKEQQEKPSIGKLTQNQNIGRFLKEMTQQMTCPICQMDMVEPAVISCGHTFCLECLQISLLIANSCPLCRAVVWNEENYGVGFSSGAYNMRKNQCRSYQQQYRLNEYNNWKRMRFVSLEQMIQAQKLKIDVWSGSSKWKKAQVLEKYFNSQKQLEQILVSFEGETSKTNQIIPYEPLKIARYGFYSFHQEQNAKFGNHINSLINPDLGVLLGQLYRNQPTLDNQETGIQEQINNRPLIRGLEGSQQAEDFLLRPSAPRIYLAEEDLFIRHVDSEVYDQSEDNIGGIIDESPQEQDSNFLECEDMDVEELAEYEMEYE